MLQARLNTAGHQETGECEGGCRCAAPEPSAVSLAAVALLDQCAGLARGAGSGAYCGQSRVLKGGTIGKHIRHTLDHFRAALDGVGGDVIDYDRRERNVPMETDAGAAIHAIAVLRERLSRIGDSDLNRPVRVRVMLTGDGRDAELRSTLGRELAFATHHAVHHHAMLAAIAAEFGVPICGDFGRAPSTINHERSTETAR